MSKRQAPDNDQHGQHGQIGQLRKRGRNAVLAESTVEIIDVVDDDDEEEEDWFNMTMSKHNPSLQDDSHSGKLRTYSARSVRAERRKNKQNEQELIPEDELTFDSQLQRALALSKQEAEKSTFQQQAEEEALQKILEQSRVETGTPGKAGTGTGALLSLDQVETGAPVSPVETETEIETPVKPARVKRVAPVKTTQMETGTPGKPNHLETGPSERPTQVVEAAPVKPTQVETVAPVKLTQVEKGASVRPTQVLKSAPVKPSQVKTAAALTPVEPARVETSAPVRQAKVIKGKPMKPTEVETAADAPVRPGQVEKVTNVRQAKVKSGAATCVKPARVKTATGANVSRAELENGTPVQPAQSKTGADFSTRCSSNRHVKTHRTNKEQEGKPEEEKAKKQQAKAKRRRRICQDYIESGEGERWMKKRRVVYHHGNFVRRPGVDTSKQTKYIITCLESYRLKLHQAQRRQLTKLEWGKPLVAEDDTRTKSRRRKGTWTAISGGEDVNNSQSADKDTQNGTLGTFEGDAKDAILDVDIFDFDNDTQNGTVSSAVGSQGHNNTIGPEENAGNMEKMEDFERPDSTSFEINLLDNPSPEHKPRTRSHSRDTSSPVVTDTPDLAESLETEEATQVSIPPEKCADLEERTGTPHHEEDVTVTESQEHALHDGEDQSVRRKLRPRATKQLKIRDVVLTDDSEESDNDTGKNDFLLRIERKRQNLKRPPLHRERRDAAPVLKQGRIDLAVRDGTAAGPSVTTSQTEDISEPVMQSCLICGKAVPEDELQEHINNELDNSS
ncbi:Hypp5077 [Branchiostoma lanceolatum]|uniref:Hypp5077 protein n=1 Tax=Branchiostoma lanceolatum TaxID=7740 RepID=A0A8K0ADF3_BRALA|nr:Hypp5077 [Branchiostoma lanceolatum]